MDLSRYLKGVLRKTFSKNVRENAMKTFTVKFCFNGQLRRNHISSWKFLLSLLSLLLLLNMYKIMFMHIYNNIYAML